MKPLSDKFKAAIMSASEFVTLLTVIHPDSPDPILLVNWHEAIESRRRKYSPFPFAMECIEEEIQIVWPQLLTSLGNGTSIKVMAEAAKLDAPDETVLLFVPIKMTVQGNIARGFYSTKNAPKFS